MKEVYKSVIGYESLYEVSNFGNVKSLRMQSSDQLLTQEVIKRDHTNYRRVSLSKDGVVKRFQVHRLVKLTFSGLTESEYHVNHKDNNGENNNENNLEWCTHSQNMIHSQVQGRLQSSQSKAGIKSGQIKSELIMTEINSKIGTIKYDWKILSYTEEHIAKKNYNLNCECILCGSIHSVALNLIRNGTSRRCKSCTISINSDKALQLEANSLSGMVISNWKVTDSNQLVKSLRGNKFRKTMFILCECINCINKSAIKMDRLKSNNPNICTICQQLSKG